MPFDFSTMLVTPPPYQNFIYRDIERAIRYSFNVRSTESCPLKPEHKKTYYLQLPEDNGFESIIVMSHDRRPAFTHTDGTEGRLCDWEVSIRVNFHSLYLYGRNGEIGYISKFCISQHHLAAALWTYDPADLTNFALEDYRPGDYIYKALQRLVDGLCHTLTNPPTQA